jgi:hypothetical protein
MFGGDKVSTLLTLSPFRLPLMYTFFCCYMPQWYFFVLGEY